MSRRLAAWALAALLPALAAPPSVAGGGDLGREVYNFRCYYCHGYAGDARTLAARMLSPPPVDFTRADPQVLTRERMIRAVTEGRPGTAMKPFGGVLTAAEIEAVVDFVRETFMRRREPNTRYHTAANGWPDHERYRDAYPFATGELALDTPWDRLTPAQRRGKRLFLASCVSCHDAGRVQDPGPLWETEAVSFPRAGYSHRAPDALSGATPFARHDIPPRIEGLTPLEREGERIYQANCAFCHAADGTARNWIGTFLEPHPRDLTDPEAMAGMTRARLRRVIREGLPGTSMPAWGRVLDAGQIEAVIAYISRAFHPIPE
ncbi:c-type cytochrome [Inmirania thermothiophila]|uniref:Cytochrome c oxidase cbb3-type subunit 3 n=1 Tax=Inmirania thermothiophila TaxID=1750597 RepID=A0A3N1XV54_9GAMM|nr:c-type cytochrome [Inmirania thermothiophila]ROR29062.1 cytochrome c oxidase cbb3-type subunit 3 [Inmirania thermothiophila]